jgi:hypothetical protein
MSEQRDYPAAHSMDSAWFAVDADGHVALFCTGENGHIPTVGDAGFGFDQLRALEEAVGKPEAEGGEDLESQAEKLGLFLYHHPDNMGEPIEAYERSQAPRQPLHVDQVPPALRRQFGKVAFRALRFGETASLQPLEFYPCDCYDCDACAYLCADGKTVRPIPGEEDGFPHFVKEFREQDPEAAAKLIFDGPLEIPEEDE